jgi:hypothetical protein
MDTSSCRKHVGCVPGLRSQLWLTGSQYARVAKTAKASYFDGSKNYSTPQGTDFIFTSRGANDSCGWHGPCGARSPLPYNDVAPEDATLAF